MKNFVLIILCYFSFLYSVFGCENCTIYNPLEKRSRKSDSFTAQLSEEFQSFSKFRTEGSKGVNPNHLSFKRYITKGTFDYSISEEAEIQTEIPLVADWYNLGVGEDYKESWDSGIADIDLIGRWIPVNYAERDQLFQWYLSSGIQLPTGGTSSLGDAKNSLMTEPTNYSLFRLQSFGSGSWDIPFSTGFVGASGGWIYTGDIKYMFHNSGDYGIQMGDEFLWKFGAGPALIAEGDLVFIGKINLSGISVAEDKVSGESVDNSGSDLLLIGPEVILNFFENFSLSFSADIPVFYDNSGSQLLPGHLLKLSASFQF